MPLSERTTEKFKVELVTLLNKYEHLALGVISLEAPIADVLAQVETKLHVIKEPLTGYEREPSKELSEEGMALFPKILAVKQDMAAILAYYYALRNDSEAALAYSEIATHTEEPTRQYHHALLLMGSETPAMPSATSRMRRAESFRLTHKVAEGIDKDGGASDSKGEILNNMAVLYIKVVKADSAIPEYEYLIEACSLFEEAVDAGNEDAAMNREITEDRLIGVLQHLTHLALAGDGAARVQLGGAYTLLAQKGYERILDEPIKKFLAQAVAGNAYASLTLLHISSVVLNGLKPLMLSGDAVAILNARMACVAIEELALLGVAEAQVKLGEAQAILLETIGEQPFKDLWTMLAKREKKDRHILGVKLQVLGAMCQALQKAVRAGNAALTPHLDHVSKMLTKLLIEVKAILPMLETAAIYGQEEAQLNLGKYYRFAKEQGEDVSTALQALEQRMKSAALAGNEHAALAWVRIASVAGPFVPGTAVVFKPSKASVDEIAAINHGAASRYPFLAETTVLTEAAAAGKVVAAVTM